MPIYEPKTYSQLSLSAFFPFLPQPDVSVTWVTAVRDGGAKGERSVLVSTGGWRHSLLHSRALLWEVSQLHWQLICSQDTKRLLSHSFSLPAAAQFPMAWGGTILWSQFTLLSPSWAFPWLQRSTILGMYGAKPRSLDRELSCQSEELLLYLVTGTWE